MPRITLGCPQYLVVLSALATIAVVVAIVLEPVGFSEAVYRLASQRGALARADVREKDTPFDFHGAKFAPAAHRVPSPASSRLYASRTTNYNPPSPSRFRPR